MISYFGGCLSSLFSIMFVVFFIATIGYFVGSIEINGISLGTAGVLLIALLYGILCNAVPSFTLGGREIVLFDASVKSSFSLVSSLGTTLFVTAVGLIAGPKVFRSFNRKTLGYIVMGMSIIVIGAVCTLATIIVGGVDSSMAVGLLTGALTSTPGLSAAKEVAHNSDLVTAGYGIAYLFGVMGVVLFVQLMPRILHVDIEQERKNFVAANTVVVPEPKGILQKVDPFCFFPFALAIVLGMAIGCIKIPGINFSFGTSGGVLIGGLLVGHFGHLFGLDLRVDKATLNFMRELGLTLFLIGAGVPGGVNFIANVRISYFVYGAFMTLIPMLVGYLMGRYIFKLSIFNNLGAITGGMTSTPALGTLISTAGTDDVAAAYAATYPFALVGVVLTTRIVCMVI